MITKKRGEKETGKRRKESDGQALPEKPLMKNVWEEEDGWGQATGWAWPGPGGRSLPLPTPLVTAIPSVCKC